jgi:hypothetical protein
MVLHEEPAEYSSWLRLIFLIPVGLFIGAISLAYNQEYEGFFVLMSESAFFILLFYFIMPRKYEIYPDKMRIVLGAPFGINIPLPTIKKVKHSSGIKAFIYTGVRFATSTRTVIEIVRNKGLNYVISPQNEDIFVEQLNEAIKNEAGD